MRTRISLALMAVTLCFGSRARAERWTEADVARLAQRNSDQALLAAARVAVAEAAELGAGLLSNPSVGWEREDFLGDAGSQDILRISVPVDLSGRPGARRDLARANSAAARSDAAETRADAVERAVLAFYAVLVAAERVDIAAREVAALDEAARILARREEAGTASGYERARLDIEAELARSRLNEARADEAVARAVLTSLVAPELDTQPELVGALATEAPGDRDALLARALGARPSLHEARRAVQATGDAHSSAGRWWLPTFTLSGGALGTNVSGHDSDYGYVAGLAVGIPLFSRGQDLHAESVARARLAAARVDAQARQIRREIIAVHGRLVAARDELARFEQTTTARVELLGRGAASGYREGERSLLELLDAQRVATTVQLRRLELAAAAKRAEVALRRATGALQ